MTLEDRYSSVMGGRKDDVTRTTPKQNRKRPLSAVLEEFEVEDANLKDNLNNNNNTEDSLDGRGERKAHGTTGASQRSKTDPDQRNPSDTRTTSASPSTSISVSSLKKLFEPGSVKGPSPAKQASPKQTSPKQTSPKQTSPKLPRTLSFGRRPGRSPTLSPVIARRAGAGFYAGDVIDGDDDITDMTRLRQMADRLSLSTRRPSFMQWRKQYVESAEFPGLWHSGMRERAAPGGPGGGVEDERWTAERADRINAALDWIKNELQEMRTQDQQLARQLLTIRSDLHRLKLARSCEEHRDMLDDVQLDLEELQEFADVLDLPTPTFTDSPLKHLGVTRMNLSARRFSTC